MNDRNQIARKKQVSFTIAVAGAISILSLGGLFLFNDSKTNSQNKHKTVSILSPGTVEDRDAWRVQSAAEQQEISGKVNEMGGKIREQTEENQKLARQIEELQKFVEKKTDLLQENLVPLPLKEPLPADLLQSLEKKQMNSAQKSRRSNGGAHGHSNYGSGPKVPATRELEMIVLDSVGAANQDHSALINLGAQSNEENATQNVVLKEDIAGSPAPARAINFMPAGSFVKVVMLNGVDAPTGGQAQSNPLPVAFHVIDTASLANQHQLNVKDCRFISAAWGDLSSERMMARTESLTCIINGETVEVPVKGVVIGEDGKAGVRGRLVTKQGQLLANALFSGALSGIGDAFRQSSTVTQVGGGGMSQIIDPQKAAQAAIGGGLSGATNSLAQYYLRAADKLFPVIEADGGRKVEILVTQGATYTGPTQVKKIFKNLLKGGSQIS